MNMEKKKKIHLKLDTDLRAVHKSLNRNGLNGRVDVKKPLLTTGRETGRKSYGTNLLKNWAENQ